MRNLIVLVDAAGLDNALARLKQALAMISADNRHGACGQLRSFEAELAAAAKEGHITAADAATFLTSAAHIEGTIGCQG